MSKPKLELTWIGKENQPRLEPRILIEDPAKSYGDKSSGNMLIHGDNLLALKALEQDFAGKINCIFIDPPYNTGNAFDHYDDGLEHSIWLSLMRDRLEILRRLLAPDGFFCAHIDDSEGAYLKVLCDEVLGRPNYLTTFYFQVRYGNKTLAEDNDYQKVIEQCHVYAKDAWQCVPVKEVEEYKVEKFEWEIRELSLGEKVELGGKRAEIFRPGQYEIVKVAHHLAALKETWATGSLLKQKGSSGEFLDKYLAPRKELDGLGCLYKVYGIGEDGLGYRYFTGPKKASATKGKFYSGIPLDRLQEINKGRTSKEKPIVNFHDFSADFGNCRQEGGVDFRSGKKPERLLNLVLKHYSRKGDLILDSFLGSGTTAAVAHKMGRRWIGIELGDHCDTHCLPRLKKVVDGTDPGGITEATGWQGGGGFKYYYLAPSILNQDPYGNWVINKKYNPAMLAAAVAKHEGFTFNPDTAVYWKQGRSTEKDFIFTTTEFVTQEHVDKIHSEMADDESLLICCKSFNASQSRHPNITIKKIPNMLLGRCEFGKEDYSLNIVNLPMTEDAPEGDATSEPDKGEKKPAKRGRKKKDEQTMPLFDGGDDE